MSSSYSDLQQYRACPRLFGFQKLGYRKLFAGEPITTGTFVHTGIAAYFRGQDPHEVVDNLYHSMAEQYDLASEEIVELVKAHKRYKDLLNRYLKSWAKDYKVTLIEPTLELDGVICHPDLIAYYQGKRVIIDYKTSYHPDDRWYDISGQADLYAYIIETMGQDVNLIIYDIISEEGIYRHMRPPRLAAGKRLFSAVQALNELVTTDNSPSYQVNPAFLSEPHPDYTCPSRCDFFTPCWLLDTDSWKACEDFLKENYIK